MEEYEVEIFRDAMIISLAWTKWNFLISFLVTVFQHIF